MGKSKGGGGGGSTQTTQTVTPQRTQEQQELDKLQLEREKFLDPNIRRTQQSGLELSEELLTGGQLPGFLEPLARGIDPSVTQSIVQESIRDIQPGLAKSGLLNSGLRAALEARTAGDIRRQSAEFNLGNLLNLAQLGLGGQAQVQSPILGFSQALSGRLGQAIGQTTTGRTTFTQGRQSNPFFSSFASAAGQALPGAIGAGVGFLGKRFGF